MLGAARTGAWAKSGSPTPAAYGGLRFTAEADNSTVQLTAVGSAPAVTLVKSFDGVNWEDYTVGEVIELPSIGDFVYLAAGEGGNETFASSRSVYNQFVINGLVAASGDITSLRRFDLIQTPLAGFCYYSMFGGCTGLTSAPELPATTLARSCYYGMFRGCTSLTSAPELHATTLAGSCYRNMFDGCTGLTSAPELHATTLADNCYDSMFIKCSSLSSITVDFSVFNPTNATSSWIDGVAANGTFYCPTALGTNETITRGVTYCPVGWTVINTDA